MGLLTGLEDFTRQDEPLAPLTWLQIGGSAQYFAEPTNHDQLKAVVQRCREEDVRVRLIGGGSNLLVRDQGVQGMVIRLTGPAFEKITVDSQVVEAGGGARLAHLISTSVQHGLRGLEQLIGIPGTVGGALHSNSGGHGGDIGQRTHEATVLMRTGEVVVRSADDIQFSYRQSSLNELAILSAKFRLETDDAVKLTRRMQKLWILHKAAQPMGDLAVGCIFKDPRGMSALSLIEQAGLKGTRVGAVEVSTAHPNFFLAEPEATSDDVLGLIEMVKVKVLENLGIELESQLEIW